MKNKAKRSAKQLRTEVINALAFIYCYFLGAELNGYQLPPPPPPPPDIQRSVVNCAGPQSKDGLKFQIYYMAF